MLSGSEAELVALSETAKKIVFMIQLLKILKISIKLPVMVRVDNGGTIFMVSFNTTTYSTKDTDIMYKYVNEYLEDRIAILFVKSADNDNVILTNNLSGELCKKH